MIPFIRGDEVHNGRDLVAHVGLEAFRTSIEPIKDNHAVGPGHEHEHLSGMVKELCQRYAPHSSR